MNDADATPDLPGRLGVAVQLLAHAGKQAGKHAQKAGGGRGELTPTRLTALAVLADAGSMRLGGFASRLGVQVSTMSRIVDIMAASGWLERRPDEADHRAQQVACRQPVTLGAPGLQVTGEAPAVGVTGG
jgi:hypothetical protein